MEGAMDTALTLPVPAALRRRQLSPSLAYALVASVVGLALFASVTPSPLYGTYRELWGFSPLVLTLVYGTYAFGVLASLILAGRLSDEVGRRPVLLVALGGLMVTSVVFMLADSVVWLFVARGLQGLATGLALGAASAARLDLHPRRDPAAVVSKGALPRDDVEVVRVDQRAVDVQHNAAIRRHRLQLPAPSGRKQLAGALGRVISTRPRARRG